MVGHIYKIDKTNQSYHQEGNWLKYTELPSWEFKECISFFFFTPVIARCSLEEITYRNYDCFYWRFAL